MDITLYTAKGSNSSERVEWALDYKGIMYRRIEVEDAELKSAYLRINHFGYVPSLKIDSEIITESMAIIELLEEIFLQHPLLPGDSIARAKVRQVCEYINTTIHSPQNRTVLKFFNPLINSQEVKTLRCAWIVQCLQKLEPLLWKESAFAITNQFSAADIFIATMYKKALQFGVENIENFDKHLAYLRSQEQIRTTEPGLADETIEAAGAQ